MNIWKKNSYTKREEDSFCPYCSSRFASTKIMSKHVDDIHIGRGLLQGDLRK